MTEEIPGQIIEAGEPTPAKKKKDIHLTLKQIKFLTFYTDPDSESYANAYQSARRVGYTHYYARQITQRKREGWLRSVDLQDMKRLKKAESNIDKILDTIAEEVVIDKTSGKPIMDSEGRFLMRRDNKFLKIQADVSQFIMERLNKKKYSPRSEVTGSEGKPLAVILDI